MAVCVCGGGRRSLIDFGAFSKLLFVKLVDLSARSWLNSENQTDPEGSMSDRLCH